MYPNYNSYYSMMQQSVPQNYPMQQNQVQPQMQASQDERIWVQNETAAEAYLVAPNGFVRLWDSQKPVFYEKRADATGRPFQMDVYEYTRKSNRDEVKEEKPSVDYMDEINSLKKRIAALESRNGGKVNAKSNSNDSTAKPVHE